MVRLEGLEAQVRPEAVMSLACAGVLAPNETVDSVEAAKPDQHRDYADRMSLAWPTTVILP